MCIYMYLHNLIENISILDGVEGIDLRGVYVDVVEQWGRVFGGRSVRMTHHVRVGIMT